MTMRTAALVLAALVATGASSRAETPRVKWRYLALSNLYAPPVVADLHPHPGQEIILSDSEARRLRCVSAAGKQLWELDGHWLRRLTSAAAVSQTARPGKTTLIVGGSDGKTCALDGASGQQLWTRQLGPITWGAIVWADLDGDGRDEAVAATDSAGVKALDADGKVLWTYGQPGSDDPLHVSCPAATADVDGDGTDEVLVVDRWGPLCLNGDGTLRWRTRTGDYFVSAPTIADADGDGQAELYCAARGDPAMLRLDARTGRLAWVFPMLGPTSVYPGSSIAVGDLRGDGEQQIVTADDEGHLYVLSAEGDLLWMFTTDKAAPATPSLGDVDGDGDVEVLLASGDHTLYCLGSRGKLEWRFRTALRLIYPATIADVDQDGKTDILLCGSDKTLHCITLDGRYAEERIPWAGRRYDSRQSGSSFAKRTAGQTAATRVRRGLLAFGGFDEGKIAGVSQDYPAGSDLYETFRRRPRGWQSSSRDNGTWQLDTEVKKDGAASLKVTPGASPVEIVSRPIEVARTLRTVSAHVWATGRQPVGSARLRWLGSSGVMREDALAAAANDDPGPWVRLAAPSVTPPPGARWLTLVLRSSTGSAWWDSAEVVGILSQKPESRVLVNQVGYDVGGPKRFTARSTVAAEAARFELLDEASATVYRGRLERAGRIQGKYGHDWGYHYWRGAFDEFDTPGLYRIRIRLGASANTSWPFRIGAHLLWTTTSRPAYRFFYYQRCGMAIAGFHGVCHLDDAVGRKSGKQYELWGGWHDAGDYNTYHNAPYTFGLARAYGFCQAALDQQDKDDHGRSELLDEIVWGGDHSRRMISPDGSAYAGITSGYGFWGPPELETDNIPNTGDERTLDSDSDTGRDPLWQVAAMARIARFVPDRGPLLEAAVRGFQWRQDRQRRDLPQLAAALDLFAVTGQDKYATLAKQLFAAHGPAQLASLSPHTPEFAYFVDAVERYDALFGEDHHEALRGELVKKAAALLELARNPFGVVTHGPKENPNFFGTPKDKAGWHVGTSSFVLNAAGAMALAYRYEPDPRYLAFVYDQFNWTLGNNPFDLCLMEGQGSFNPPTYHHRYTFAGVPRGAVPGSVVNGITWRAPGDDRPYFDLRGLDIPRFESNEVWLPHNVAYLNALVNLHRSRHGGKPSGP